MKIESPLDIAPYIDHTTLKPTATAADVEKLCAEAMAFGFQTVCVNSVHVELAARLLESTSSGVCSVIGFPLGANLPEIKVAETRSAVRLGASEVDMVMNLGWLKAGDDHAVLEDIRAVVDAAGKVSVKVIIESGLLDDEEIVRACLLCKEGKAAFVKTCTGFGTGSATTHAVSLMRQTVGDDLGVKASGGIKTFEDAQKMIEAGASRIGASSSVAICGGAPSNGV